jgi:hypothetical protein
MHKLKLQLENLRVDTFETMPARNGRGTVHGEQCTCYTQCSCPGCPTCDASCNGTCAASNCGGCDISIVGGTKCECGATPAEW